MSTPNRSKEARRRRRLAARAARERISWETTVPVELNIGVGSTDPLDYDCPDRDCRAPPAPPAHPPRTDRHPPAGQPNRSTT